MESKIGSSTMPLSKPEVIKMVHDLKNTLNVYSLAKYIIDTAKNVEVPPWKTEDPIWLIAFFALYSRFS